MLYNFKIDKTFIKKENVFHVIKMIKKILPLILVVLLFITLGCFTAEIGMNINPDGKGNMSILMDMTKMKPFVDMNADAGVMYEKANICETFMKSAADPTTAGTAPTPGIGDIKDFSCKAIDDYKVQLNSKEIDFVEQGLLTITEDGAAKIYTLTLKGEQTDEPAAEVTPEQKAQMKMLGVSMVYKINMPGNITNNNAGTVEGSVVTVDLIEDMEKLNEGIVIESRYEAGAFDFFGMDIMLVGAIGGGIILIIIVIIVIVVLMKKKKPQAPAFTQRPQPTQPAQPAQPQQPTQSQMPPTPPQF